MDGKKRSSIKMVGGTSKKFTKVDLDSWGRAFLDEFHLLLSPERASQLARVNAEAFKTILKAKIALADAISKQLEPIFDDGMKVTDDERDYFEEQLFATLSADYSTAVMVNVTAMANRHNGIPNVTEGGPNPLFLGRIAADKDKGDGKKQFTFSNVTIQIPDSARPLAEKTNFLVSARHPEDQTALNLKLDFEASAFDYKFHKDEEMYGLIPSTWLSFALAGARRDNSKGDPHFLVSMNNFTIPLPLRSFPALPRLLGQNQVPMSPDTAMSQPTAQNGGNQSRSSNSLDKLKRALEWNARFEFAQPAAAQDDLIVNFRFNQPEQSLTTAQANHLELFVALAQFRDYYPAFKQRLADPTELPKMNESDVMKIAFLFDNVAAQWSQIPAPQDETIPTEHPNDFALRISGTGQVSNVEPDTTVTGDAAQPRQRGDKTALPFMVRRGGATVNGTITLADNSLIVEIKELSLLAHQTIHTYVQTERNSDLVTNRATNAHFVYDTPHVTFPSALVPSFDVSTPISVEEESLKKCIGHLFSDLTLSYTGPIKLELRIGVHPIIAETTRDGNQKLTSTLPLYLSEVEATVNAGGRVSSAGDVDYRQSLLDALRQWKANHVADVNIDTLELNLTVFSSLTPQKLPLARVRQIEFVVKDSAWWQKD